MLTDAWNGHLDKITPGRSDIYFMEEYARLYQTTETNALAYVHQRDSETFLLPLMLSEIPQLTGHFDFETPYGYGGPVTTTDDRDFWEEAIAGFVADCQARNIVAGLFRFHPFLENQQVVEGHCEVLENRMTISMDLSQSPDEIWRTQISAKNRNVIRKAQSSGLVFEVREDPEALTVFRALYRATMDRVGAGRFYYFSDDYFNRILENLRDNSFLGVVRNNKEIVSAALFLYHGEYGHYHLSGSDSEYLALSPNNLLLYGAALELKSRGVKQFHLGGGARKGDDDGLFKFKARFSPRRHPYYIGKWVFDPETYQELCADWERRNPEKALEHRNMLLRYRM